MQKILGKILKYYVNVCFVGFLMSKRFYWNITIQLQYLLGGKNAVKIWQIVIVLLYTYVVR